ncbi:VOC family protein [Phenylobacterium sp.]|uniref:VOC family protein n=1 Tax=Phenylobacterium sp. TaxID=1871053 RepID=UPI0035B36A84
MPVTGVGGVFFRAKDPEALGRWYQEHLGVVLPRGAPWDQAAGPTIIMPFPQETGYFAADKQWMINFRVSGLDELLGRLRAADIAVRTDPSWDTPETGRFARIHDPEGNAIELWEPPAQ